MAGRPRLRTAVAFRRLIDEDLCRHEQNVDECSSCQKLIRTYGPEVTRQAINHRRCFHFQALSSCKKCLLFLAHRLAEMPDGQCFHARPLGACKPCGKLARRSILTEAGQRRLPIGDLAYWLPPHLAKQVLEIRTQVRLDDVETFIGGHDHDHLVEIFNTDARAWALRDALEETIKTQVAWGKTRRSDRYTWLLPSHTVGGVRSGRIGNRRIKEQLKLAGRWASNLPLEDPPGAIWLSAASLEAIDQIRRLNSSDRGMLSVGLGKAASDLALPSHTRPWQDECDPIYCSRHVAALYQHSPTPRMRTVVERFVQAGITNVGHLALLHPEIARLSKRWPQDRWVRLTMSLRDL